MIHRVLLKFPFSAVVWKGETSLCIKISQPPLSSYCHTAELVFYISSSRDYAENFQTILDSVARKENHKCL